MLGILLGLGVGWGHLMERGQPPGATSLKETSSPEPAAANSSSGAGFIGPSGSV